ncbi:MAG: penicillin acylase family protein [Pirellulales bacterium]|nr:penicillin acylase family protein [Pirellulales bacterium]
MKPLKVKNPRRPFTAARDENGVPHIEARTWTDALYALGYLHAIDRPTQMLFARAVASGRSAEMIADKPQLLETDRFFRRAGLDVWLDREIDRLDDRVFVQITAYCQGVNDGLKSSRRSLPMWAVGFERQPWTQQSVLLICNLLAFGGLVVGQLQNERLLLELAQTRIMPERLRELFAPLFDDADFDLLRQVKISNRLSDEALELITDLPRLAGSNAWAVAPTRSRTGGALLASDPHLEVNRLPAIWYEAVLRFGGRYVLGATLPGSPLVAVGRTPELSWGVTYFKGDNSDYFIEDCRPGETADAPPLYRRGERWLPFDVRKETIFRKGQAHETMPVFFNDLGTLDADPQAEGPGLYLSTAWTGHQEGVGAGLGVWLDLVSCPTVRDAMDLVRECPQPTLSWVLADREGHIGRQASGCFPLRAEGHNGMLPVPAWDPCNHWQGLIPTHLLPGEYDPPSGFVSSANEACNPPDMQPLVTLPVPDYRKRRIDTRLTELTSATIDDMQQLQYDVVSTQAQDMVALFLPHLPEGDLKNRLANWDCSYTPNSYEATLFSRFYREVLLQIFGTDHDSGGIGWRRMLYLSTRVGFSSMVITLIDRLLHQEHSHWWEGHDKGELIRKAAEGFSIEPEQPWAVTNAFCFTNRFFETKFVGRALGFHTAEMPMPGCFATPFQGHLLRSATRETTFAPSYHFVTDMSRQEAWTNVPGGTSESRFSRWYKNDIARWASGRYKLLSPE